MSLLLALLAVFAAPAPADQPAAVIRCGYSIVHTWPHDPHSFTQGLFWYDGHLYEGTGQYRRSRIARLDLETGKALAETPLPPDQFGRSEEHTSELQSLMRISYAVFCLKKKNTDLK